MPNEIIAVLVGVACAGIGYLVNYLIQTLNKSTDFRNLSDRLDKHLERFEALSARVIRIETFMELMGKNLAEFLHHPTTPNFDRLAEKYCNGEPLTKEEWEELKNECLQLQGVPEVGMHKHSAFRMMAAIAETNIKHYGETGPPHYPRRD